jgi:thiamine biosynthesis lipoprotein
MLAVIKAQGIDHAMVVAGGEVIVGEPPPGASGWKVDIGTADADEGGPPCALTLRNTAVSTSGDEHQFLELNGHRYSHVINPATGWPLEGESSTTVMAKESATADALGTTFSLMSVEHGMKVAPSIPDISVLWVRKENGKWKHYASRDFPAACGEPATSQEQVKRQKANGKSQK